ncbi:MAG: pyridoxal phosphate-dependent aminotransferase, partial [Anaerolineae bacterium]|nr:pyridoxal phosphate-dependent aminotransferase [Anaerolineae bacterium]
MASFSSPTNDPLTLFRLKPIRVARVSEISETTAASAVPREERVDFHIGNPLQDARLSSAFLRLVLGISIQREDLHDANPDAILEHLRWKTSDKPKLEFLIRAIQKSAPYAPRGGYQRTTPHPLIKAFQHWLEHQQEPLEYDTGEQSGRREIILTSGGIRETLRVILLALSEYLEVTPARVLCYRYELGAPLQAIPNLLFDTLDADERVAREQIEQYLALEPQTPTFVLIGALLSEETRRQWRWLSIAHPLFFIEANNAPNHLSLAREAKLVQRVIRLLTPAIFAPHLETLATVFVVGNADFLNVIENVHFNLKGTPSVSEIELLTFLLEQKLIQRNTATPTSVPPSPPSFEGLALGIAAETILPQVSARIEQSLERSLSDYTATLIQALTQFEEKARAWNRHLENRLMGYDDLVDEFSDVTTDELLEQFVQNLHRHEWCQSLQRSFLRAFVKHQPHYRAEACQIVSGSARTALGILGFHCGIREVVIPDLSWSYEQCFPVVHSVPLKPSFDLDVDGIIEKVEELRRRDSTWSQRGAVVINNPHNSTGRIFAEADVRRLLTYCLQHHIYVIDDLAYQNVAPVDALPEIKTVRQIASELVQQGVVGEEQAARVITVHSMSKTDCLAGARLAVIEIRESSLAQRFRAVNALIQPNLAAIFLSYLFYRNAREAVRAYWHLRNAIFRERTHALMTAVENLPAERNPYGLKIIPPAGSMYPLLHVERLPAGLSLDWLASSLARRGIGLLPLATFARTEQGYEIGRTTFRLTLGGVDGAEALLVKTRRLLIDLNRLIGEEQAHYNRKSLAFHRPRANDRSSELAHAWERVAQQILHACQKHRPALSAPLDDPSLQHEFIRTYAPERLEIFRTRLHDRARINAELIHRAQNDNGAWLAERLERELTHDTLTRRQELFRLRAFDRTVHPTQMYSL